MNWIELNELSPLLKQLFLNVLCPLLTRLLNLVKIRKLFKEKVFPSVALSENIYNLIHTVNNCQRFADWQQNHLNFSRWTVWSCYRSRTLWMIYLKCVCPNDKRLTRHFSKLEGLQHPPAGTPILQSLKIS